MQQNHIILLVESILVSMTLHCSSEEFNNNPISESLQMVVALADDWSSTTGYLRCFQRPTYQQPWTAIGEKNPVSFGKNGLGWGRGLHNQCLLDDTLFTNSPRVIEGAKKSPVGVFALGIAFGKASPTDPDAKDIKIPYIQITNHVWGINDIKSVYYNRIVDDQNVKNDWNNAEDMCDYANQGLYEFGVYIEHNYENPIPGMGSCFFIHVHRRPGSPTRGCTACAREQVKSIINWLDPKKTPIFVQFPVKVFNELRDIWNLPNF